MNNPTDKIPPNLSPFWMPFTDNQNFKKNPKLLVEAQGMYYKDSQGNKILDGTSGLWCCNLGHNRKEIADSVYQQLNTLDYAPAFQLGSPGAFELASRLQKFLPKSINNIFFTNSGSESVDTALKIALAYHQAKGDSTRTRLIGREKAYHGTGFGGISVGGLVNNRKSFGPLLPGVDHLPHTLNLKQNAFSKGEPTWGAHLADHLEDLIALHGQETIAAVIVEPVAGSVGVIPPPQGYLKRLRKICDQSGILLIFDEVITGFGRMGEAFASDYFDVTPDIMTMAKGLTNGAIPMGAVGVKESIYQSFMDAYPKGIELFHGYTYSGNPVSSAAALATLDIFENEGILTKAKDIIPMFEEAVFGLQDNSLIEDIRNCGLMAGIQLKQHSDGPGIRGKALFEHCFEHGVLTRFNGDTIAISPPLVATPSHIEQIVHSLQNALQHISQGL